MGLLSWRVEVGNHVIEANSTLWGRETIKYDGEVKVKEWSFFGASRRFTVREDGELVEYEVQFRQAFPLPRAVFLRNKIEIL